MVQSYKYFTRRWVVEMEWKQYQEKNIILILGKVRHSFVVGKSPLHPWTATKIVGELLKFAEF